MGVPPGDKRLNSDSNPDLIPDSDSHNTGIYWCFIFPGTSVTSTEKNVNKKTTKKKKKRKQSLQDKNKVGKTSSSPEAADVSDNAGGTNSHFCLGVLSKLLQEETRAENLRKFGTPLCMALSQTCSIQIVVFLLYICLLKDLSSCPEIRERSLLTAGGAVQIRKLYALKICPPLGARALHFC